MKRTLINVFLSLSLTSLAAQSTVEPTTGSPTNIDCENALRICDDFVFPFENVPFTGCLWFSFAVTGTTNVDLSATSNSGKFALLGPYPPGDSCRTISPTPCNAVVGNELNINQVLSSGIYYITVSFSDGIGNDIRFDMPRSFNCDPVNIDCESAMSFCDDVLQSFTPSWAAEHPGCLWYRFEITDVTTVDIRISSPGSKIHFYTDQHCPTCGQNAALQAENSMNIASTLEPGTYFISVSVSVGTPGPVNIDVVRGLHCQPPNTDCSTAIPFCEDLVQPFSQSWAAANQGCLWYRFEITDVTTVDIRITSPGSKIHFYTDQHCPTCGQNAALQAENSMNIASTLVPGTYFISVSVSVGTPGPVNIDVVRGLHCQPPNTDCSTAIPFCEDLVQPFSQSWAAANEGCLWYSFELVEPTPVQIVVNCPGSKIRFYRNVPCPRCDQRPNAENGPSLHIQETLPPGIYYFAVPVDASTPGPVTIDVINGLSCGEVPTNVNCRTAIPFCKDMTQSINTRWSTRLQNEQRSNLLNVPETNCLWYRFDLTEPTPVNLVVSSPGSMISFYANEDCPDCGQLADLASNSSLHLQSTLPAGIYFISVTISASTPGPITINVISGLSCEGPDNINCGSALSLCVDTIQLYTNAWAVANPGCLWYTFEVIEETAVIINIVSTGAIIKFYQDLSCPLCTDASSAQSTGQMTLLSSLPPGTYFISVSTGPSTSGSVAIDIISGVSCESAPPNLDCGTAIPFCTDLIQSFSPTWAASNPSCLWYSFELTDPTPVSMVVSSTGSTIRFYRNVLCPDCTDEPGIEAISTLELAGGLLPGTYFIAVTVDQNTPGPVSLDVLTGLDCDSGPSNVDCASALSLCSDLQQSFPPAWAAAMPGCLWYSFEILATTQVAMDVVSQGSHIRLFSSSPCPNCGDIPLLEYMHELNLDSSLEPGTYFVAVSIDENTPGPVHIDVIAGLDCDVNEPTNLDCDSALPFCDDLVQNYSSAWAVAQEGCLWYSFELASTTGTEISISSPGSNIQIFGPLPQGSECPDCSAQPLQSGGDVLTIQATLQPGVYFISVTVIQPQSAPPQAASGSVVINVISGLSCDGGDPTNLDCGLAIPFCGDVNQPFSMTWALQQDGCLWYTFELEQQNDVHFIVSSPGSQVNLYGPFSAQSACPGCAEDPVQYAQSTMTVQTALSPGIYFVSVSIAPPIYGPVVIDVVSGLTCIPCVDCIPPLELVADSRYLITAWAHVPDVPGNALTFTQPVINVESPIGTVISSFGTSGVIIDGWQRMEGAFVTPSNYTSLRISFTSMDGPVYYDDIRLLPEKGSMKSYVYDRADLRFVAELDERHYATFYEYDAEGKLARVKKETERGVMTIQETRNNSSKVNQP